VLPKSVSLLLLTIYISLLLLTIYIISPPRGALCVLPKSVSLLLLTIILKKKLGLKKKKKKIKKIDVLNFPRLFLNTVFFRVLPLGHV